IAVFQDDTLVVGRPLHQKTPATDGAVPFFRAAVVGIVQLHHVALWSWSLKHFGSSSVGSLLRCVFPVKILFISIVMLYGPVAYGVDTHSFAEVHPIRDVTRRGGEEIGDWRFEICRGHLVNGPFGRGDWRIGDWRFVGAIW